MKTLIIFILTVSISGYALAEGAKALQAGHSDYIKSSLCIKENIAAGVERSQIEVVNSECFVK